MRGLRCSGDGPRQAHHTDFRVCSPETRRRCRLDQCDGNTLRLAPVFGLIPLHCAGAVLHVGGRHGCPAQQHAQPRAYRALHVPLESFALALGDLRHAGAACVSGLPTLRLHVSIAPRWLVEDEGKLEKSFTVLGDSEDSADEGAG